jgi:nitronate monooxygenase
MPLTGVLATLPLPIIGAPLFIVSNPKLVIEQCKAGVVGAMPALNARPAWTPTNCPRATPAR